MVLVGKNVGQKFKSEKTVPDPDIKGPAIIFPVCGEGPFELCCPVPSIGKIVKVQDNIEVSHDPLPELGIPPNVIIGKRIGFHSLAD